MYVVAAIWIIGIALIFTMVWYFEKECGDSVDKYTENDDDCVDGVNRDYNKKEI